MKAIILRTKLMKKWKVDKKTNGYTWKPSKKWCKIHPLRDYISHEIDIPKKLDPNFNFPKIQLMSHWVEQNCWYRAVQQYSVEKHEQKH
jgi:hypothetical protein